MLKCHSAPERYIAGEKERQRDTQRESGGPVSFSMTTEKKNSQSKKRYIINIYQSSLGFDKRPVLSVHLVVEAAGVTEVVAVPIPPPQRGRGGSTVHTLATL
jgi:hypothetical protein